MVNRSSILTYERDRAAHLAALITRNSAISDRRSAVSPTSGLRPLTSASPRPRAAGSRAVIDTTSGLTWSSMTACAIDLGIAESTLFYYLRSDIPVFPRGSHRAVHLSLAAGGAA